MKKLMYMTASVIALGGFINNPEAKAQDNAPKADTGIAEIIVTAQKRGENLQNVPIAITAISAESLQQKGVTSVIELTRSTPNIMAAPFTISSSTLFFFMRGMGVGNPGQITTDPSIGVYENGIYNPRPTPFVFDLLDPERVEILRGPQGTLYGRNTTGGALNVISRAPSDEPGLRQLASFASRNQYRSITNLDFGAVGGLAIKGTLAVGGDDGFAKNIHDPAVTETNDFGMSRHVAGRVAARWKLGEAFTADYSFSVGKLKTTGGLLQTPGNEGITFIPGVLPPYHFIKDQSYRPVNLPWSVTNIRDHGLTLEWRPSDTMTVRSITGIRYQHFDQKQDTLEAYGLPIFVNFNLTSKIFTQELQIVGSAWNNRIKYAAGLYYFRENSSMVNTLAFFFFPTPPQAIDLHSVSKAAYAQVTVTPPILDDRLDLTVGGRYTDDRKEASRDFAVGSGAPVEAGTVAYQRFNPAVTLAYRWSDTTNTYAKFTTGYRAGGFDEAAPYGGFTNVFLPESLKSYEIGLKTDLLDRRLRVNMAAFYNDFKDIQLALSSPTDITRTLVKNAGQANIKGVEADVTLAFIPGVTVNVNYAYLDTDIKRVQFTPTDPNVANQFVIPYAPKHSLSASADWVVFRTEDGPLTVHADYNYKGSIFTSAGAGPAIPGHEFYRMPSYTEVNGRISLGLDLFGKPAQVAVFAKNLLNSRHAVGLSTSGSQAAGFSNPNFFYAAPRTIGGEVSFAF